MKELLARRAELRTQLDETSEKGDASKSKQGEINDQLRELGTRQVPRRSRDGTAPSSGGTTCTDWGRCWAGERVDDAGDLR
eukprot:5453262-Prorocentrum_lima.AAC.1